MKIWIDLDNTPHVPFFKPIIRELEKRGHTVLLTARDAFQVCELAAKMGLACRKIGRHYGKNPTMKIWGLGLRALQLLPLALFESPALALSHGSRAQIAISNVLRIPTVMLNDYEFAKMPAILRPRWEMVPSVMMDSVLHAKDRSRIRAYQGIKEDVYAPEFKPDPALADELGLKPGEIVVTVRPPATEAHYFKPESQLFFVEFMNRFASTTGTKAILLPRNKNQEAEIRREHPGWFNNDHVVVPRGAVDGLNLLWHSDLVVSGGGTMNREAAALGVPVYSTFRGTIGEVDKHLNATGRLVLIESVGDIHNKIRIERRARTSGSGCAAPSVALQNILDHCEEILRAEYPAAGRGR
jgi:uncharacterized protein